MKIENLRSIIKESIGEYLKEIDEAAKIGAIKASIAKCEEAIGVREKKMNMEGLDEAYHDMLDKGKMAELKSEIKALSKSLEKYKKQLAKFEKVDEVTDDVVTDETMVTDEGSSMRRGLPGWSFASDLSTTATPDLVSAISGYRMGGLDTTSRSFTVMTSFSVGQPVVVPAGQTGTS